LNNCDPFKEEHELKYKMELMEKSKILDIYNTDTLTSKQKHEKKKKLNNDMLYDLFRNEYKPPRDSFRSVEKEKWIGKNFNSMVLDHRNLYSIKS